MHGRSVTHADTCSDSDADAYSNAYSNACSDGDADSDTDTGSDGYADSNPDSNARCSLHSNVDRYGCFCRRVVGLYDHTRTRIRDCRYCR